MHIVADCALQIDEIDIIDMDEQEDFSLFTTMRYTSPDLSDPTLPIIKDQIPLLEYHFDRLEMAFAHFSERDGSEIWGSFPSRQRLWEELEATLTRREKEQQGDWRVCQALKHMVDLTLVGPVADTSRRRRRDSSRNCPVWRR